MLRPLTLWERGVVEPVVGLGELLTGSRPTISGSCDLSLHDYAELIVASGFPALQQLSVEPREAQLDGYLQRITDVDMEEAGLRVQRPATVRAWLRAYAAASSTTARWERIRDAATPGTQDKPARSTTGPYRDVLTRLRILDEVEAWIPGSNQFSRPGSSAKHQLVDRALAARLLGVGREDLVTGSAGAVHLPRHGALFGALFESLATLDVRVYAGVARAVPAHFRTHDGRREVDLVVERPDGGVVAIEVKLGNTVADHDVSHLRWLHTQLGDRLLDSVVLTTGSIAHRRSDRIAVVPLGALGP